MCAVSPEMLENESFMHYPDVVEVGSSVVSWSLEYFNFYFYSTSLPPNWSSLPFV
jgi:hypothetical protein